jgi:hypothetical protein
MICRMPVVAHALSRHDVRSLTAMYLLVRSSAVQPQSIVLAYEQLEHQAVLDTMSLVSLS